MRNMYMTKHSRLNPPLVGRDSRTGTRGGHANDDYCDFFVVDRGEITTRLPPNGANATTQNGYTRLPARQLDQVYVGVVADGVTSTAAGAQASRLAVEAIKATLQGPPSRQETISEWLEFAITRANDEILFEAKRNPEWQGMSTTIVLAALVGEKLYVMHLGDSRAYLIRDQAAHQLTADHTWAQEAMDAGTISSEEAAAHPGRNQLLRFLGASKGVTVDRGLMAPNSWQREEYLLVEPGDAILLCTDGLHRYVTPSAICDAVHQHTGVPQDAVDELIGQAVANGARDDVTAILLEVPAARRESAMPSTPRELVMQPHNQSERKSMSRLWLALLFVITLLLTVVVFYQIYLAR